MNLYYISQRIETGYDTYDAMVVAAENEDEARLTLPPYQNWKNSNTDGAYFSSGWAHSPDQVNVVLIGTATPGTPKCVILESFRAG